MPNDESERGPRTISYWWIAAIAVVLFAVGLVMFLGGDSRGATSQVDELQRRPVTTTIAVVDADPDSPETGEPFEATTDPPAAESTTTVASSVAPTVTMPDGSPAPEGVGEVLQADGALTLALVPPSGWTDPITDPTPLIAPVSVQRDPSDDAALVLSVGCAGSAGEYLAQVSVTESPSTITVMAVAIQPGDGDPCDPSSGDREFRVPLSAPVGSRPVVVVPAGPVPG